MYYFDIYYVILILPAIFIALFAQARVSSAFRKYSQVRNAQGLTGAEVAQRVLRQNGINDVSFNRVAGNMTDYYDPKQNAIFLSENVYDSNSIAAVGVAAHEAGHAVQYAAGYFPIKVRTAIIPATRFGSMLSLPLIILGFLFNNSVGDTLLSVGVLLYGLAVFFQLVTLPIEYNASRRALSAIETGGILNDDELPKARRVLNAAAMTYLASLIVALAQLLRILMIIGGRRRK